MSMRRQDNMRRSPMDSDRLKGNMRMDRKPNATRISDPSHPLGKRKEIDNVMKKARQQPANEYWDKKLLEAEEKDPNRWKHTGYKKMYGGNPNQRKSRSPIRKTPISPRVVRQPQSSPMRRRMSRTPDRYRERYSRKSPPRATETKIKDVYVRAKRPMSPPPKARTPSISSCSDSQCSGCSSDDDRRVVDSKRSHRVDRHGPVNREIIKPTRMRPTNRMSPDVVEHVASKKNKAREVSPKRRHLKRSASPFEKKSRREIAPPAAKKRDKTDKARTHIKIEGEKRRHRSASSASDDSSASEDAFPALTATTKVTLNERFSKMAQWNHDRKYDMSNMKITKKSDGGDRSAVMIQEKDDQDLFKYSPIRTYHQFKEGEGHYPEELMQYASAQALGLSAWNDDVRVRYDYYKSKGYLRDLTIQDYIKWEEWWYRYQEWLAQERYFETLGRDINTKGRRGRKISIPIHQRLN